VYGQARAEAYRGLDGGEEKMRLLNVEYLSAALARVHHSEGIELWAICQLRKPKRCWPCDRILTKSEIAWSPVGNQIYRARRICRQCIRRVKEEPTSTAT
jgi:hypothetical protein